MAKHDRLTEEEFSNYKPPARAVNQLYQYILPRGLSVKQVKALDCGCWCGRFKLWLREQGFDAHGVDIDPKPIDNGLVLFNKKGYQDTALTFFSPEGRTVYADGTFYFFMTDNRLDHIREIDKVMAEIDQLTSEKGRGILSISPKSNLSRVISSCRSFTGCQKASCESR
jgi:2-polyprenyl-3-methyl-5-hydroxy-6-metoxy-1,4-benzoquinol methylase